MSRPFTLTVRTNAAIGRLADLQRRAARLNDSSNSVLRAALRELGTALEELQAANDHLLTQSSELGTVRARADELERRTDEFIQSLPLACVWTNHAGTIVEVNEAAAALLNVARPRLPGKPLMLFLGDRQPFFDVLRALTEPEAGGAELAMLVRPRERRPLPARLKGCVLREDARLCWFITPLHAVEVQSDVNGSQSPG